MLIMFTSVYFYGSHQENCIVQEMWYALISEENFRRNYSHCDSSSS